MIKRLNRSEDLSLYQSFETRVRAFASKYDLNCPIEPLLHEMLLRWVQTPALAGYFGAIDSEGTLYGHLASWITSAYGVNKLFIYQAEVDRSDQEGHLGAFMPVLRNWIDSLNAELPKGSDKTVSKLEWTTWHSPELWSRYFRALGFKSQKLRNVIEMEL